MLTSQRTAEGVTDRTIATLCSLAAGGAVAVTYFATPLLAVLLVSLVLTGVELSLIDFRTHRLPNRIVGPLALGMTVSMFLYDLVFVDEQRFIIALGYAVAAVLGFFLVHLTAGLGMGDVKYAYPIFLTLGWLGSTSVRVGLMAMCLAGAAGAAFCVARRKTLQHALPYGPFMTVGLIVGLLVGA